MADQPATPPLPPPQLAEATVEPTEFSVERNESMRKLYELFEAEWKPMIVTQQQNNFTVGLNSSQVLKKLPEGKTFKFLLIMKSFVLGHVRLEYEKMF